MSGGCGRLIARATGAGHDLRISGRGPLVSTVWVVVGLGAVGAVIALVTSWQRGGPHADLGTVSSQWISEHRLGRNQDSRR
jgi:hypothetical protein